MSNQEYSVWQLTDGTVVIQGAKLADERLRAGDFEWANNGTRPYRMKEKVFAIIERI